MDVFLEPTKYTEQIEKLTNSCAFYLFRDTSHLLSWITQTRPELLAGVNILSQVASETIQDEDVKLINELIKHIKNNLKSGLQ